MSQETESQFIIQRLSEVPESDIPRFLDEVVKVEEETWPEKIQAPLEKFVSRSQVFPEGFLLISLQDKGLVGVSTAEIIDYDPSNPPNSWEATTDNGWIKNSHNPNGNALYLVSVGVSPKASGLGVGTKLVTKQIELTKELKKQYLVLGSRLPGFAKYHAEHPDSSAEEYLLLNRGDGLFLDPEIRFYKRCGLGVEKLILNYMEDDPESENYGVVMVWENTLIK